MSNQSELRFAAALGKDLNDGIVGLPSLPEVVLKIRSLLEREDCDFDQVSQAVRIDPALVSRLMAFANSAFHSRGGDPVESLDVAISRLGFEVIRNAALSLAVKQLFLGEQHKGITSHLKDIWSSSIDLASMSYTLAKRQKDLNEETGFMCGLLNTIGKLYILTKSQDFPEFLGDEESLEIVLEQWHSQIGKSIVEVWGFDEELCQSVVPGDFLSERSNIEPTMVDVIYAARMLVKKPDIESVDWASIPSCVKLDISAETMPAVIQLYEEKLQSVRQSLSQAA